MERPLNIQENVPLAPFTTFKIGGPARYFASAESEEDVIAAFRWAGHRGIDTFVLGGGSNILVSDDGFNGLVIRMALRGVEVRDRPDGKVIVKAGAGEDWDDLVALCIDWDLAGFECLSGIPGSVGGTPVQNVGAYGQDVAETIVSVRCYDKISEAIVELTNEACGFSYRKSIFNSIERGRYVVLSVAYEVAHHGPPKIEYKDLREIFGERTPTLSETRAAVIDIRRRKSMVIDAHDQNSQSAGSFFKNPIVETGSLARLAAAAGMQEAPHFPFDARRVKVPAAWLIEKAGFRKGHRLGSAGISENHSLALINCGGAAAREIVDLKNAIQEAVAERFSIDLEPEPIFVGF